MKRAATILVMAISLAAAAGCGDGATDPDGIPQVDPGLNVVSGDAQLGAVGTELLEQFVVSLGDADGNAIAGATVSWEVLEGEGAVSSASTTTDAQGRASIAYTLGAQAGDNLVQATSPEAAGEQVNFNAEALVPTALATFAGQGQSARIAQPLAEPVEARITASDGRGVPGVTVEWVASGDASVSSGSSRSDADGVAGVGLTLGSNPGVDTVTASAPAFGLGSVTFTATGSPAVTVVVEMENIAFNAPGGGDDVTVLLGDTIRWVNLDSELHTATSQVTPTGGSTFDSGTMTQGEEFEFVPDTRGEWRYFCEVHPVQMRDARITVN